jgi:septum formation protein
MNLPDLILASASPRRATLLQELGLPFSVCPSEAREVHSTELTAVELARVNAYRKARKVSEQFPDALVLGADTLVYLQNRPFGKPQNIAEAHSMLVELQGRTHEVTTGVCLFHSRVRRWRVFAEVTEVRFHQLTPREIDAYLASIDPLDKAGGYAIQEGGTALVEQISGSFSNVVGLPLERLRSELADWAGESHL